MVLSRSCDAPHGPTPSASRPTSLRASL
jgi:hypothetical protein